MRPAGMFSRSVTQKPGVFSPVTGQAIVTQTTASDEQWADMAFLRESEPSNKANAAMKARRIGVPEKNLVARVESHTM